MKKFIYLLAAASVITACGGSEEHIEENVSDVVVDTALTPVRAEKAQMVFQTIPSPLETASIFQASGTEYDSHSTNPVENVSNYHSNTEMALNLGVYGADLSYANIYDQSQESMFYMNCSKKLADGLGVTSAFDAATMERIEDNMNNRDSLMTIINDAFWIADAHLKENGQHHLSALIITGGWVEGLYLGTRSLNSEDMDPKLMQRIADQKYSLDNLVELLATYDNDEVTSITQEMKTLQMVFDKIEQTAGEANVTETDGVATIGGGTTLTYEVNTILEITSVIDKIRNGIIK